MLRKPRPHEWPDTLDPEIHFRREGRPYIPALKTRLQMANRWEVYVKRLMQQGLTRYEAEDSAHIRMRYGLR